MARQKKFVRIARKEKTTIVYLSESTNSISLIGHPSDEVIQKIAGRFPTGSPNRRANMLAAFVEAGLASKKVQAS